MFPQENPLCSFPMCTYILMAYPGISVPVSPKWASIQINGIGEHRWSIYPIMNLRQGLSYTCISLSLNHLLHHKQRENSSKSCIRYNTPAWIDLARFFSLYQTLFLLFSY